MMATTKDKIARVTADLKLSKLTGPLPLSDPLIPASLELNAMRDAYVAELQSAFAHFVDNIETDTQGSLSKFEESVGFAKSCYRKAIEIVKMDFEI